MPELSNLNRPAGNEGRLFRWFDSLFILRPTLIFPLWTVVLAGTMLAGKTGKNPDFFEWLAITISFTSMFGLMYLLNQMRDRSGDKLNNKSALVAHELVSRRQQRILGTVLAIVSPLALLFAGNTGLGVLLVASFLVAGILYNYTPIALEKTPWGGIVSGAVGAWLLLKVGEMVVGGSVGLVAELPYILSFTAGCLLTGLPDRAGDSRTGKMTFAVRYGERACVGAGGALIVGAMTVAFFNRDFYILIPAIAGSLIVSIAFLKNDTGLAVIGNKMSIFLLALTIGIAFPVFLAAMLIYFPVARWYHLKRFGLAYPNFGTDGVAGTAREVAVIQSLNHFQ